MPPFGLKAPLTQSMASEWAKGHWDWIPPWRVPTPRDVYCRSHTCGNNPSLSSVIAQQAKAPDPREWVEKIRASLPNYSIQGPGAVADCGDNAEQHPYLESTEDRLLARRPGVASVEEAARECDAMPGCTHFTVTVAPVWPYVSESELRAVTPGANLCRGRDVKVQRFEHSNTFVGIKRNPARSPPADPATSDEGEGQLDGPMLACAPWASGGLRPRAAGRGRGAVAAAKPTARSYEHRAPDVADVQTCASSSCSLF
ncbi:unnamed protein product [Prorocentrum cordatum]|uniref:Uncharacterized protein n=1 Tax=Prorocentrum cordatum TaxID=2364126 RepID=A0ABN9U3L6_9DINO|nr:unnamed protein product [Polarella glacialis]